MQRQKQSFAITDFQETKEQLLYWANQYGSCSFLDNHQYKSAYNSAECLVGVGVIKAFLPTENHQEALRSFVNETNDWLFGHVCYDYRNVLTPSLRSDGTDNIGFESIYFFQPEIVLILSNDELEIQSLTSYPENIYRDIKSVNFQSKDISYPPLSIKPKISKEQYLSAIDKLKQHILRGDCYEINFCQEFFSENTIINPLPIYTQLTAVSPNPFSCYYKLDDKYLLCASPERYIKRTGNKLLSQPIKGTFKRDSSNSALDELLKKELRNSIKDRAENVMVVDLVRNDFSKICKEATVEVTELFGIYTFPQIHQMISTIAGEVNDGIDFVDILEATFPMGSMTGAPKRSVMQLINLYEKSNRGLYSGTVGYISPDKDFDFNVVIRSVLYNSTNKYLSYQVGSGITHYSDPLAEYEECLLKAASIRQVLQA